tara:strand:+ start:2363 stop:2515 length:153 start_codon:yes stop_codon:yes gene_type:complete
MDNIKDIISRDKRFFKQADLTRRDIITILKEALDDRNWDLVRLLLKRLDN